MDGRSIIAQITAGENEQEYKKWANYEDFSIRYHIAKKGYFPELFIYDEEDLIREVTVEAHPNYIHYLLNKPEYLEDVSSIISKQVKPQLDILKLHIQNIYKFKPEWTAPDMELKLQALTHKPTLMEKSMTPRQLYQANSPLWALTLTAEEIIDVWEAEYETKTPEEKLMQILQGKHSK